MPNVAQSREGYVVTIITENNNPDKYIELAQQVGLDIHEQEDFHLFTYAGFAGAMLFGMSYKWDFSFVYNEEDFLDAIQGYKDKMRLRAKFIQQKPLSLLPVTTHISEAYEDMDLIRFLYNKWGIPAYRIHSEDEPNTDYLMTVDESLNGAIYEGKHPIYGDDHVTKKENFKLIFDYA